MTSSSPPPRTPIRRPPRGWITLAVALGLAFGAMGAVALAIRTLSPGPALVHEDLRDHYVYGSVGGDTDNGIPLAVFRILPQAFPELLPANAPRDYTAFGFLQEQGRPVPMGFSLRGGAIPRTGFNCSVCHMGEWRLTQDEAVPVLLGMPASGLDIAAYFRFLFAAAEETRFTGDYLLPIMEAAGGRMGWLERSAYRFVVIPSLRRRLQERSRQFEALFAQGRPPYGPGRVDTFSPYKLDQLAQHYPGGIPFEESFGTVAYPSIWEQGSRQGHVLNWDGNSPTIRDRNMGAAFGAGATRESIDVEAIQRVTDFLRDLPSPAYPWGVSRDSALLRRGEALFRSSCAGCHAPSGPRLGSVIPLEEIGTDPNRVWSYTPKLNDLLLAYGKGYEWQLTEMRSTDGYAAAPLTGIWARAPYLHNGSVPTLLDLLSPPEERPTTFFVGHGLYDTVRVGIRQDVPSTPNGPAFLFDTRLRGNDNQGHAGSQFGTAWSREEKRALLEYLRTL